MGGFTEAEVARPRDTALGRGHEARPGAGKALDDLRDLASSALVHDHDLGRESLARGDRLEAGSELARAADGRNDHRDVKRLIHGQS